MGAAENGFCIAGVEVVLRASETRDLAGLTGYYDLYPSRGGEPALVLDLSLEPGLRGPKPNAPSPGFDCAHRAPGHIELSRDDALGELWIPQAPQEAVRGRFRFAAGYGIEAAIRIALSVTLPRRRGFVLHASAVTLGELAWVFAGVSGAGKSTIAEVLLGVPNAVRMADELLVLSRAEGQWSAHVAPFHGVQGLPHGLARPVGAAHFLAHASEHSRRRLSKTLALASLLRHILVYARDPSTARDVVATAGEFIDTVPCYSLAFAPDVSVAQVLDMT